MNLRQGRRAGTHQQAGRQRNHAGGPRRGRRRRRGPVRAGPRLGDSADRPRRRPLDPADQRQPGLLRAVRARPDLLGAAQRRRPRVVPASGDVDVALLAHPRETDLLRALGEFPRVLTAPPNCASRTGSPGTSRSWPGRTTASTTPAASCPAPTRRPPPLTTARLWLCAATARCCATAWTCSASRPRSGCRRTRRGRCTATSRSRRPAGCAAGGARRARPAGLAAIRGADRRRAPPRRPAGDRLARTHGTPLFVLDEGDFRGRAEDFAAAFSDADVHYASKAFLCGQVARWIAEDGLHLDVCSGNELSLALAAGFPAERIALHGNNKSLAELRWRSTTASATSSSTPSTRSSGCPLATARGRGRRAGPGADPRHRRHRGAHPRVHRHRPRGPEVRLLPGHRRRADRRASG